MTTRAVPPDLITFRSEVDHDVRYSMTETPGSRAVLALGRPGDRVEMDSGADVSIVTADGRKLSVDGAVKAHVLTIVPGYPLEELRNLFEMAMHNEVRSDLLFRMVRCGENPADWDVETSDERIDLLDADGHTRASIWNPLWWRVRDPDFAGQLAEQLVAQAGLVH
jgi:hypothetical protein